MNAAVIVAAGRGTRMGLAHNKVFEPLCGVPVIVRTARALFETGLFDGGLVIVTGAGDMLEIRFGEKLARYRIVSVAETVRKENAAAMYELIAGEEFE